VLSWSNRKNFKNRFRHEELIDVFKCIDVYMDLKKIEKISKALSDVNRLKILDHITGNGGIAYCSTLQECVNLAQPSISHHIKILIEADLIDAEKEGRNHKYVLNMTSFNGYLKAIEELVWAASKKPD
jgi:ArsR family transcriptional regulator